MTNGSADRDRCGSLSSLVILFLALIFALAGVIFGLSHRLVGGLCVCVDFAALPDRCTAAASNCFCDGRIHK
jgi:hypothetical protein